jgi:hypothetical protein
MADIQDLLGPNTMEQASNKKDSWDQKPPQFLAEDKREQASASALYNIIRKQVESQMNTSNQRIFWLILSQSFFFRAFVMLVKGQPPPPKMNLYNAVMWVIPAASLATIISTYIDILGAYVYVGKLRRRYREVAPDDTVFLPSMVANRTESLQEYRPTYCRVCLC